MLAIPSFFSHNQHYHYSRPWLSLSHTAPHFPALTHLGRPDWPRHSSDLYVKQNHPDRPPNYRPSACSPLKSALSWPRHERCQLGQRTRFPAAFHHQSRSKCGQAALAVAVALRGRTKFTRRRMFTRGRMFTRKRMFTIWWTVTKQCTFTINQNNLGNVRVVIFFQRSLPFLVIFCRQSEYSLQ